MPSLTEQLDRQHPEYALRHNLWHSLGLLFKGGDDIRQNAAKFLLKRPKEPQDIYNLRLQRFFPQNMVGTVISWYTSALWKKEIAIDRNPIGIGGKDDFYSQFLDNCDSSSTKFTDFWETRIEHALLYKRSFVLVDLPNIEERATNLKAQMQAGELDAYLVPYEPKDIINWSLDRFGNLNWVVIKTVEQRQEFLQNPEVVTRWWYFDRQSYQVYESREEDSQSKNAQPDNAALIGEGAHAMAGLNKVPLICLEMPDSLWLGNRMFLQAIDHANQDNSLAFALFMANLPIPVFKTDQDLASSSFSESSAIMLRPGEDFGWNEPSGVSFVHSAARVDQLREEIYRTCYLQAQGRSGKATPAMQSGYSKELDMMPAKDILNAIGHRARASMKESLEAISAIRGDKVQFSIRAFNFEESDAVAELSLVEQLEEVAFPSDTALNYQRKRAARAVLTDATEDEKAAAMKEIDDAPTIDEAAAMKLEAQQLAIDSTLTKATKRITADVAAA